MAKAVERMLANNLADFEGLKIEGTIVINEALLNILVQDYLQLLKEEPEEDSTTPTAGQARVNIPQLLQALHLDQINIHLAEGKMFLDLKIRR